MHRLARAAKDASPIYVSFKYGHGTRTAADGCPYTDLAETVLHDLVGQIPTLLVLERWQSIGPELKPATRDVWLNAILRKRELPPQR